MAGNSATDLLQEALATVNSLGAQMKTALDELVNHLTDGKAHTELWEAIQELQNSGQLITESQVTKMIEDKLKLHSDNKFNVAHTGWDEVKGAIDDDIKAVGDSIAALTERLDKLEGGGEIPGPSSSLSELIAEVNAKYDPQIQNLTNMIVQAQEAGDAELVKTYQDSLNATLEARNNEIKKVTQDWVDSQPGAV